MMTSEMLSVVQHWLHRVDDSLSTGLKHIHTGTRPADHPYCWVLYTHAHMHVTNYFSLYKQRCLWKHKGTTCITQKGIVHMHTDTHTRTPVSKHLLAGTTQSWWPDHLAGELRRDTLLSLALSVSLFPPLPLAEMAPSQSHSIPPWGCKPRYHPQISPICSWYILKPILKILYSVLKSCKMQQSISIFPYQTFYIMCR